MINSIEKYFDKRIKYTKPEGGLFLWCTVPKGININKLTKKQLEIK